ncbi:hypothetical protein, conserved [Trypanosoma brucei brucei TREU927]|uniref:SET domain-containing protein n=1 Tax=Trypanosoma brucei brucei (strain 927/4 GUTat10.1) TaxID=185431 RepID=Q57YP8_TRYB2|nr:hypothetical protein, conserved [Trypanosoma brucei brucei TREU927]AAX69271.1 hypothetical protein, conserved [Trypanosoma brucei]AAZ13411.1 hypothetical protein, conserved [Trypanosoma brucei brucei TREU927]
MPGCLEVRYIGESHGVGSYTLKPAKAGDVLLQEYPVAFAKAQRQDALEPHRICGGCGMILTSLKEECRRLALLALEATTGGSSQLDERVHGSSNACEEQKYEHEAVGNRAGVTECAVEAPELAVIVSPDKLYDTFKDHEMWEHFQKGVEASDDIPEGGADSAEVRFCSMECKEHCLGGRGGRFVLPLLREPPCNELQLTSGVMEAQGIEDVDKLRTPSADTIMYQSTTLTAEVAVEVWPTKAHALATLEFLAEKYNARLRLVLFILARFLSDILSTGSVAANKQFEERLGERVQEFVQHYDEGASRGLSPEQRSFLRFSWKCVCRWITLCCVNEGKVATAVAGSEDKFCEGLCSAERVCSSTAEWFPLQLYLRCFWVTDANAHMYVVVSPLYSLLSERLPILSGIYRIQSETHFGKGRGENVCENEDSNVGSGREVDRLNRQMKILQFLFQTVDPNRAHSRGVALYDAAAKINHSCAPSVRFVPTHGGVKAVVVALRDIPSGEEVRTSYIEVGAYPTNKARREFLLSSYGFNCDCPLCVTECEPT